MRKEAHSKAGSHSLADRVHAPFACQCVSCECGLHAQKAAQGGCMHSTDWISTGEDATTVAVEAVQGDVSTPHTQSILFPQAAAHTTVLKPSVSTG
eukprot:67803-Chlamydomonas_euryale.AAC.1